MQSVSPLLALLQCPYCQEELLFTKIEQEDAAGHDYGILSCSCSQFPVIDGIPIFLKSPIQVKSHVSGNVEQSGPSPESLIHLVQNHRGLDALISLITFPYFPRSLKKFRLLKKAFHRNPIRYITVQWRKTVLRHWAVKRLDYVTAEEWFSFYFQRTLLYGDLYNYFYYRFAQPRYLASLSLLSTIPRLKKPILDLTAGFGHLGHYLTQCEKKHEVVHLDRNFFPLWVSKLCINPNGFSVCADAETPLPFQNSSLGAIVFSDGIHLLKVKQSCFNEMRRITDGTIMFARTGNRLVKPNEGSELSPREYLELMNTSECRFLGETELLDSYLQGFGPNLKVAKDPESYNREKWLSIVLSKDPEVLRDHGKFQTWPHSIGNLGLNPIYKTSRLNNNGTLRLTFEFPSTWFAFENALMGKYYEPSLTIDQEVCEQIRENRKTPSIEDLITRFIVLGMPEKYARSSAFQEY